MAPILQLLKFPGHSVDIKIIPRLGWNSIKEERIEDAGVRGSSKSDQDPLQLTDSYLHLNYCHLL